MLNPLLSIIVPVYNGGAYLRRCIDCISKNLVVDAEIILVDDGSTDISCEICDEYAKRDKHIRVIHQSNKGLSVARNVGLKIAKGQYIHFVDADDIVLDGIYTYFRDRMLPYQADIVYFDFVKDSGKTILCNGKEDYFTNIQEFLLKYKVRSYAWNKFWKRSFLVKYNLAFVPKIYSEDVLFTWEALSYSGSLLYSTAILYSYSTTSGSLVQCRDLTHLKWTIESYILINERLKELSLYFGKSKYFKEVVTQKYKVLFNRNLCTLFSFREISRVFKSCASIGIEHLNNERQLKVFDFCYHHPILYYLFHNWILYRYFKQQRFKTSDRDYIQLSEALELKMKAKNTRLSSSRILNKYNTIRIKNIN